jgi:TolB-like protein
MKCYAMALFLLLSGVVCAEPVALLVLPFDNATSDESLDGLSVGLPELLTVCFSGYAGSITVVERTGLDALLEEQSLGVEHYVTGKGLNELGRVTGADFVLRGSITEEKSGYLVQALLFNISTTVLATSVESSLNENDLVSNLCNGIAVPLVQRLAGKQGLARSLLTEQQPERQQLLMTGLKHYYSGSYAQAMSPFLKLVKSHPGDPVPHYWLARSFEGAGLHDFARIQLTEHLAVFPESTRRDSVMSLLEELEAIKDMEEQPE